MGSVGTSVLYALDYLFGFVIFGIAYWVLDGIMVEFQVYGTGSIVYNFAHMFWTGAIIVYIILGVFWLPSRIKEWGGDRY